MRRLRLRIPTSRTILVISSGDIRQLAGLLEGEGTFRLVKRAGRPRLPMIAVNMTDEDVIRWAARLLGGRVSLCKKKRLPHHKQQYLTSVSGSKAVGWMMTLYMFLGTRRRARIREVLDYWKHSGRPGPGQLSNIWSRV
jgi:hypothetical protein